LSSTGAVRRCPTAIRPTLPVPEDLVDDLETVLDEVGSERAALFGFSDAGALCAMFAATHPERVSGLILYSTAALYALTNSA
jgi:pimeloyl-ACP methyl ester carboxylesterase